jgi:hypothetical protein
MILARKIIRKIPLTIFVGAKSISGTGLNLMEGQGAFFLGINLESFDIGSIDEGDFYVKF